jgi:hypothetical protein
MSRLTIEINAHHIRITEMIGSQDKVYNHTFNDLQDYRYIEQLDAMLEKAELKNRSFDIVALSWSCFRTTLLPSNVFEEGSPERFFELCFGSEFAVEAITFDRLHLQGIVNIYELPLWVKSYFTSRYPRIVIRHEGSQLIQYLLSSKFNDLEVILSIHNAYFLICIGKNNKLIYYSPFDFQDIDDILYHVMFTFQQKELYHKKGALHLFSGQGSDTDIPKILTEKLSKIAELNSVTISVNQKLILNSLENCV